MKTSPTGAKVKKVHINMESSFGMNKASIDKIKKNSTFAKKKTSQPSSRNHTALSNTSHTVSGIDSSATNLLMQKVSKGNSRNYQNMAANTDSSLVNSS